MKYDSVDTLFDANVVQDPYEYYGQLRETDPVHEVAGTGTFLVSRPDLIQHVVARPEVFSSSSSSFLARGDASGPILRPVVPPVEAGDVSSALVNADPPVHARQRKLVSRALSTARMKQLEPLFRELVEVQLETIPEDGRLEWMSRVAVPLPMVMVARILGVPDSAAPELTLLGYGMLEQISGFVDGDRLAQLNALSATPVPAVMEAYAAVKSDPSPFQGTTLIGILAQAVVDGELNDIEALTIVSLLISAGGESTTSLTGNGVRILAERPDLQDRLRFDPALIPAFVEEALRLEPPFRGHYRRVTQDTELAGTAIPAGAHIVLMWPAANRDPLVFDDPDHVHLDRPNPRNHFTFGWGIHLCVGAPLARIEARVAFETLLARTRSFRIDAEAAPLVYHRSLMIRRLVSLPLVLEPAA
jgi:cytochrome P450